VPRPAPRRTAARTSSWPLPSVENPPRPGCWCSPRARVHAAPGPLEGGTRCRSCPVASRAAAAKRPQVGCPRDSTTWERGSRCCRRGLRRTLRWTAGTSLCRGRSTRSSGGAGRSSAPFRGSRSPPTSTASPAGRSSTPNGRASRSTHCWPASTPRRSTPRHSATAATPPTCCSPTSAAGRPGWSTRTTASRWTRSTSTGVEVSITLTRGAPAGWGGLTGRVDAALLALHTIPAAQRPDVLVCGPTPFVESVARELLALGHDAGGVKTERFGASGGSS